jgi:hypothetical protein
LLVAILCGAPAKADIVKEAECLAVIDGEEVMSGPCRYGLTEFAANYNSYPGQSSPYPVGLMVTRGKEAYRIQPYEWLGHVTLLDACWVNERVRICAWPLQEHAE